MLETEDNQPTGQDNDQTEALDDVGSLISDLEESEESSDDESVVESGESENSLTYEIFNTTGKFDDAITTNEEFLHNINECMTIYEFSEEIFADYTGKENKKHALDLLINYVAQAKEPFSDQVHALSFAMFKKNCFRTFALPSKTFDLDADESDNVLDPAWYHRDLVYDYFLNFLSSLGFQCEIAAQYLDKGFVIQLLELFNSSDVREREALIPILHRIYVKFVSSRAFIRQQINHIFLAFVYEAESFNGIAELLAFVLSVINGLKSPIKQEHVTFLERILLPLYKTKSLKRYHIELKTCVNKFIEKESRFKEVVMRYLLKCWPKSSTQKEMVFLNHLEGISVSMSQTEFKNVIFPLFKQLNYCALSYHFQVAERALSFWNNFMFMMHVNSNVVEILPIVVPCLVDVATAHWNANIKVLAANVLKWFMAKHENLFNLYEQTLDEKIQVGLERDAKRQKLWETTEQKARANMERTSLDE